MTFELEILLRLILAIIMLYGLVIVLIVLPFAAMGFILLGMLKGYEKIRRKRKRRNIGHDWVLTSTTIVSRRWECLRCGKKVMLGSQH